MTPRKLFVAGASGPTGRQLMALAASHGVPVLAHARPKAGRATDASQAVFPLADRVALVSALRGCTTLVQLIGTKRERFATGDTYESSDIGTTRTLLDAGREAGIDHVVLLSSAGAGFPLGAYLRAKAEAERLVKESTLGWTIFRPSVFISEDQHPPGAFGSLMRAVGLRRFEPIPLEQLAFGLLRSARERAPLSTVLEGAPLFAWASSASR